MDANVAKGVSLALVGLAIVFVVQFMIATAVALARNLDEKWQKKEQETAAAARKAPPTIDAITLVLISSAVTAVLEHRKFRIRQVRRLRPTKRPTQTHWRASGRAAIHRSHEPRQ